MDTSVSTEMAIHLHQTGNYDPVKFLQFVQKKRVGSEQSESTPT